MILSFEEDLQMNVSRSHQPHSLLTLQGLTLLGLLPA